MDIGRVDPDLRAATRRLSRLPLPLEGFGRRLTALALRFVPFPAVKGVRVSTLGPNMRRYSMAEPTSDGALLWVHGGGLVSGSPRQDDALCSSVAARVGIQVFSVDYRLAPEHPFPAAHEDLLRAWDVLQAASTHLGVDPERIVVGGESAGAGLATALAQHLRDRGGIQPLGQWLFAPMLDDRTAARRDLDTVGHFIWNNTQNRIGWSGYLRGEPGGDDVAEYAVPARRADLTALPPAWIGWGDIELFADECAEYARRLAEAGVDVVTDVVPGALHGFENWAHTSPPAAAFLGRARDWLAARLA